MYIIPHTGIELKTKSSQQVLTQGITLDLVVKVIFKAYPYINIAFVVDSG